ncbi:hypothetical protein NQ315_000313 [Exocentrus adspersus]|uniref:Fatty acyl-CoA reductase n=1 Tax=Exocentrus adspersus TaxID=1586481 RepID=A0AAV8VQK3_9CUCU|nr:hypothetical protein NQ315_000313 [Exocentrus adspersus]
MDGLPTIPEYFAGKTVFMTGATGFIGKVLVEKLLRSCPDVAKIYVLTRAKKGKSVEERIARMFELPLFDLLRQTHPENLEKVVPVVGDVSELHLGISAEDRAVLVEKVNVVYHIAASVRFDDPVRVAIIMNIRGTREVVLLAKQMKRLEVLVHFSTTYCHTDKPIVEEKIYPPTTDWRQAIELAEKADPHVLQVLTAKYTHPFPNTYTFTKGLGEHVVNDLCDGKIPAIIIRPSIVSCTMVEPMPGWTDSFNGPVGIMVAAGKGVMRSTYSDPDVKLDTVPCDIMVKCAVVATWKNGLEMPKEKYGLRVYNCSGSESARFTTDDVQQIGKEILNEICLNGIIWNPNCCPTKNWYSYYFRVIFYQLLPAVFIDGLLMLLKKKPILIKIDRKIFIAHSALSYFMLNQWIFKNGETAALEKFLSSRDAGAFSYQWDHPLGEQYVYLKNCTMAARRYLLHESDETLPQARVHFKRMKVVSQVFNLVWYLAVLYLLYKMLLKVDVPAKLHSVQAYFESL